MKFCALASDFNNYFHYIITIYSLIMTQFTFFNRKQLPRAHKIIATQPQNRYVMKRDSIHSYLHMEPRTVDPKHFSSFNIVVQWLKEFILPSSAQLVIIDCFFSSSSQILIFFSPHPVSLLTNCNGSLT
jgi:hypothetical protein